MNPYIPYLESGLLDENAKMLINEICAAHVRKGYTLLVTDGTIQQINIYIKNKNRKILPVRLQYNKYLNEKEYRFRSIIAEDEPNSCVFWEKDLGNNAFALELKKHIEAKTKLQFLLIS